MTASAASATTATIAETALPPRRKSAAVVVGGLTIGGDAPVVVQAMTDTDTANAAATATQCAHLAQAGAELVRITVNTPKAASAVAEIRARLDDAGITAPLVGDFHYNGHKLLAAHPDCARALAKYRINPGNVGRAEKRDSQFAQMIRAALDNDKAVRIGVNWGSLDQELLTDMMNQNAARATPLAAAAVLRAALVESALRGAASARALGLGDSRIVLSAKVSRLPDLLLVYRALAARCDNALHVGLTEAGMGTRAVVATAAALGALLADGIGDTIRASLTPRPGGDRAEEARVCREILQAVERRRFAPQVVACPGCGRTTSDFFRRLAAEIEDDIEREMPAWRARYAGVENLTIAVMGCVVNGPGESKMADIGVSLPGAGENPVAPVFVDGRKVAALKGDAIAADFKRMLGEYIETRFAPK